jgi:omega-6 fatty acid desaturase (delta-12 desaturase)
MTTPAQALFERWCTPPKTDKRPGDTALGDQATRGTMVLRGYEGDLVDEVRTYRWAAPAPLPGRPAALLVHGWGSRATHFAAIIRGLTAKGIEVAAFDAPGHGESGGRTASLPRFAGALKILCDRLRTDGCDPIAAVGYSFGGLAGGIACLPGLVPGDPLTVPGMALIASPVTLASATASWLEMAHEPQDRAAELMSELTRHGFDGARFEVLSAAGALPRRLLIVHDEADPDVPIAQAEALAACRPDATLIRTQRFGHARILLARPVVQAVADFVLDVHGTVPRS